MPPTVSKKYISEQEKGHWRLLSNVKTLNVGCAIPFSIPKTFPTNPTPFSSVVTRPDATPATVLPAGVDTTEDDGTPSLSKPLLGDHQDTGELARDSGSSSASGRKLDGPVRNDPTCLVPSLGQLNVNHNHGSAQYVSTTSHERIPLPFMGTLGMNHPAHQTTPASPSSADSPDFATRKGQISVEVGRKQNQAKPSEKDATPFENSDQFTTSNVDITVYFSFKREDGDRSPMRYYFVLFSFDRNVNNFVEFGRSEVITQPNKPQFKMEYSFAEKQSLVFQLYREPGSEEDTHPSPAVLGTLHCSLGEILGNGRGNVKRRMIGCRKCYINIKARVSRKKEIASFNLECRHLNVPEGTSMYCLVNRIFNGKKTLLVKTPKVEGSENPLWERVTVPVDKLTSKTMIAETPQQTCVTIMCQEADGKDSTVIGNASGLDFSVYNLNVGKKHIFKVEHAAEVGADTECGRLALTMNLEQSSNASIIELFKKKLNLKLMVAVDFAGWRTGAAASRISRFYKHDIVNAMTSVARVMRDYDPENKIPLFGYGGQLKDGTILNDFPCNFNPSGDPNCKGPSGLSQAYNTALEKVLCNDAGLLTPILQQAQSLIQAAASNTTKYFVLLVLSTGHIGDIEEVAGTLQEMTDLPISVVFVGIGNRKETLEELSVLEEKLKAVDSRPMVKCVKYSFRYTNPTAGTDGFAAAFVEDVLSGLPLHISNYMANINKSTNEHVTENAEEANAVVHLRL